MVDLIEEYRNAEYGAGWWADTRRGRLTITGTDATAFLQALVTADVAAVAADGGVYAAYLTPQGRMIADLALYRRPDGWLADVPATLAAALVARLDGLIFTEDVQIADVSETVEGRTVAGGAAAARLASALGLAADRLTTLALRATVTTEDGILLAATDGTGWPTFEVLVPAALVSSLDARFQSAGLVPLHAETAEALRLEAGRPAFGPDMGEDTIPLEAGLLDRAISTTKGCYVGQEVIIRVLHRGGGRIARRLMQLETDGPAARLAVGATLVFEGREVGQITSTAWSPGRARAIALGYVRRETATPGARLLARSADGEQDVTVTGVAG